MEPTGYIAMPLYENIQTGREDWELTQCPNCGNDCWDRPNSKDIEVLIKMGYIKVCTRCMLAFGTR